MKSKGDMLVGSTHQTRFNGIVKVVSYVDSTKVQVQFEDTGYTRWASATNIRKGLVKDKTKRTVSGVGYVGTGGYSSSMPDGSMNPVYTIWADMLRRCYDERYRAKWPSYAGCTVASEWHNFQTFAKWVDANAPESYGVDPYKWHLDKDITSPGNREYGPGVCKFVTIQENVSFSNRARHKRDRINSASQSV